MPAPEQFYQPQPFDAPHTDHGERAAQPPTSPRMEQVVTQLAAAHHVDLSQKGATLSVEARDRPGSRWQMSNIDGERIGVTRFQVDEANALSPDIDLIFAVTEFGWEPREIVHAERPWDEFAQAAQAQQLTVFDAQGNLRYDVFTEVWAQQLEQHGRLTQEHKLDESRVLNSQTAETTAPFAEAERDNHIQESPSPESLQTAMTEQEILDTVSSYVAKVRRDRARGQLFSALLEIQIYSNA